MHSLIFVSLTADIPLTLRKRNRLPSPFWVRRRTIIAAAAARGYSMLTSRAVSTFGYLLAIPPRALFAH
jgi:hypothetical protein